MERSLESCAIATTLTRACDNDAKNLAATPRCWRMPSPTRLTIAISVWIDKGRSSLPCSSSSNSASSARLAAVKSSCATQKLILNSLDDWVIKFTDTCSRAIVAKMREAIPTTPLRPGPDTVMRARCSRLEMPLTKLSPLL